MITTQAARARPLDDVPLTAWQTVSFAIAHAVLRGLLAVLALPGLYRFGRWFGTIEYLINYKRRRRFGRMLDVVIGGDSPPRERRRRTLEFFRQRRCDKIFYLVFDCIPRDKALSLLEIENQALLDQAVARGRGIQLATAHHGPLHVMGLLMTLRGYKVAAVREPHEGAIRKYVQDRFDRLYPEFHRTRILSSESFPREILRTLQEGFMVGSSMDVNRIKSKGQKNEEVTFFGQQHRFLSGPMWIACRCRSPVLQVFVIPLADFRYRFDVVETLLDPDAIDEPAEAIGPAMQRYATNVERYLRDRPSLISRV